MMRLISRSMQRICVGRLFPTTLIAGTALLIGCQPSSGPAPMGAACLPGSPIAKQCQDINITSNPFYPESQSPQLTVQALDPTFAAIVGRTPQLVPLATGFGFTEGPVFLKDRQGQGGMLFITDQIHNSIYSMRWNGLIDGQITPQSWEKPKLFRNPSGVADGQTPDLQGHLLTAETTGRRVSITRNIEANLKSPAPQAPSLVDTYQGKRLNSPNDLVVKSDGTVWFTDPSYGSLQFPPQPAELPNNVYRFDPKNKQLTVVVPGLVMPNGIAFGPGEKTLYVIDSGAIQGLELISHTSHIASINITLLPMLKPLLISAYLPMLRPASPMGCGLTTRAIFMWGPWKASTY